MRIAQVVTYISKDGAFGGPVAVAVAQSRALAAQGHDVELIAAWDGQARVHVPGVHVTLFKTKRRRGLSSLLSPALVLHLRRNRRRYDAVHLHFGRDLMSLSAWTAVRSVSRRVVLQPHGMILPDRRPHARLVDLLVVRRALRRSKAVLTLTRPEAVALGEVAGAPLNPVPIRNGITVADEVDVVRSGPPVALFLARLHPRKNVMVFAEAARLLVAAGTPARFRVVGPDEGDLPLLQRFIADHGLEEVLIYAGVVGPGESKAELSRAAVYVLPSVGEVYPMTVLEALAEGTPVVLTDDSALSEPLASASAARVVPADPSAVADAIDEVVGDETERQRLGLLGHAYARCTYGIESVALQLIELYEAA